MTEELLIKADSIEEKRLETDDSYQLSRGDIIIYESRIGDKHLCLFTSVGNGEYQGLSLNSGQTLDTENFSRKPTVGEFSSDYNLNGVVGVLKNDDYEIGIFNDEVLK